jgi:uncharacterized DUF497 family protein
VDFEWDSEKAAGNLAKHGVSFEVVLEFDWDKAVARVDARRPYGEIRLRTLVTASDGLRYMVIFTPRHGKHRIISVRRAGDREFRRWHGTRA